MFSSAATSARKLSSEIREIDVAGVRKCRQPAHICTNSREIWIENGISDDLVV